MLGFFVMDEKAHKLMWSVKGASSAKCCFNCKNIVRCEASKIQGHAYLRHVSSHNPGEWHLDTVESFVDMADKLQLCAVMRPKELERQIKSKMSKFMWCEAFQTYKTFAVAAVSLACDKVKEEMEQLQIPTATSTVFEDVQLALYHIIKDAAPLAIPTLAKAYNGVQCLPVETRKRLNIRLRDSLISVAVSIHDHSKDKILDCILQALEDYMNDEMNEDINEDDVVAQFWNSYHHIFEKDLRKFPSRSSRQKRTRKPKIENKETKDSDSESQDLLKSTEDLRLSMDLLKML